MSMRRVGMGLSARIAMSECLAVRFGCSKMHLAAGEDAMCEIVPVRFALRWTVPVYVVHHRQVKAIRGPGEALRFMRTNFAVKSGPAYRRALGVCLAALCYDAGLELAKLSFITAYEDQQTRLGTVR